MLSRLGRAAFVATIAATSAACATVTRGTDVAFTVTSEPSGAAVQTTNGHTCEATPCTFRVRRRGEFDVTLTKPGYRTATTHIRSEMSTGGGVALAGNAIVGGLIGVGVDAATGAMNDLRPNPLNVVLQSETSTASTAAPEASAAAPPAGQ
jgi:hypothetical protein